MKVFPKFTRSGRKLIEMFGLSKILVNFNAYCLLIFVAIMTQLMFGRIGSSSENVSLTIAFLSMAGYCIFAAFVYKIKY